MSTEVAAPTVPIYLAGEFVEAGSPLEVRDPTPLVVQCGSEAGVERGAIQAALCQLSGLRRTQAETAQGEDQLES